MNKSCDILIIGAGVIGSSIAYHLASMGVKNIIVIDKNSAPGLGSTSKATGGIRLQFGSEINVQLSILSRQKLLNFTDELEADPGYKPYGYLFLASNQTELSLLKSAVHLQQKSGLSEVREVTQDEIKTLNPYINSDGIIGGSFSPTDGFIAPMKILEGYINGAKKLSVNFIYNEELKTVSVSGNKISSVKTNSSEYSCGTVVNASGAWAGLTAMLAGLNIPVMPLKRQVACMNKENILPENLPMTIFVKDSFHFRVRDKKLILLMPTDNEISKPLDMTVENKWLANIGRIAKSRILTLGNSDYTIEKNLSWAGLYEMSPDEHVLLGLAPGFENFYLANGSSGHGVMHSPAIGQLLAELITYNKTTIDITPLRPSRFIEGKPIESIKFF